MSDYTEHQISMAGGDGDPKPVFDYKAPLPDLHIPVAQSWEPAAKHYRDIEPDAAITAAGASK